MNEDRAKPYDADDAFDPIVESLLKYPLDSREFTEAAQVATAADVAEAMRQFEQTIAASKRGTRRSTCGSTRCIEAIESPGCCASVPE